LYSELDTALLYLRSLPFPFLFTVSMTIKITSYIEACLLFFLFSQNSLRLIQVGAVAVFVTRHRQLVGGGKKELQHIVRVIVLNMVCTSLSLSILNGLNFCILFSERKRYRGIKQ
jgi:hypothetical protein